MLVVYVESHFLRAADIEQAQWQNFTTSVYTS